MQEQNLEQRILALENQVNKIQEQSEKKKNQFGHIRFYMDQKELENFISTRIEERYRNNPIKLIDVTFDRNDESIDFHFITIMPNVDKEEFFWKHNRVKINPSDVCKQNKF